MSGSEEGSAREEEESEVLAIQQGMAETLDESGIELDLFKVSYKDIQNQVCCQGCHGSLIGQKVPFAIKIS